MAEMKLALRPSSSSATSKGSNTKSKAAMIDANGESDSSASGSDIGTMDLTVAEFGQLGHAMRELRAIHSALRRQRRQIRAREAALAARESAALAEAEAAAASAARAEADERSRLELRLLAAEEANAATRRECDRLRDAFKSARDSSAQLRRRLADVEAERDRLARAERSQRARLANLGGDSAAATPATPTASARRRCCGGGETTVDVGVQTPAKWLAAAVAAAEAEAMAPIASAALQLAESLMSWDNSVGRLAWSPSPLSSSSPSRPRPRPADAEAALRCTPPLVALLRPQPPRRQLAQPSAAGLRFLHRLLSTAELGGAGHRVSGAACVRQLSESLAQRFLARPSREDKPHQQPGGGEDNQLVLLACLLILRAASGDFEARQRAIESLRRRLLDSREARRAAVRNLDGGHWLLLAILQSAESPVQWPAAHQRALLDAALCLACDAEVGTDFLRRLNAADSGQFGDADGETTTTASRLAAGLFRVGAGIDRGAQERAAVLLQKARRCCADEISEGHRLPRRRRFLTPAAASEARRLLASVADGPLADDFLAVNLRAILRPLDCDTDLTVAGGVEVDDVTRSAVDSNGAD